MIEALVGLVETELQVRDVFEKALVALLRRGSVQVLLLLQNFLLYESNLFIEIVAFVRLFDYFFLQLY